MKKNVFKSQKLLVMLLLITVIIAAAAVFASAEEASIPGFKFEASGDTLTISSVKYAYPDANYVIEKHLEKIPQTVSAWVYVPSSVTSSEVGAIFGNTEGRLAESGIDFKIGAGAVPTISIQNKYKGISSSGKNNFHYNVEFENSKVPTDAWSYVTFVYGSASGIASCYINGSLKESKYFYPEIDDEILVNSFVFGGDNRELNHGYFKGGLGDLTVYSDVRSAAEISSDYAKGLEMTKEKLDKDDVILYYDIDENDIRKNITDDSGNGYDVLYEKMWITEDEMAEMRKSYGFTPAYSFAVVGDTQKATRFYPQNVPYIYDYIVDNITNKKIEFSIGLGDITDKNGTADGGSFIFVKNESEPGGGHYERNSSGTATEWDVVKHAISIMDGKVDYSLIEGNHDGSNTFNAAFNNSDFTYASQYANDANSGMYNNSINNTWRTFTAGAGNVKYLIMNIGYRADSNVIAWANEVLGREAHKDHNVIITTHAYLDCDGTALDSGDINCGTKNSGVYLWENLVSKHENVKLMLSGHVDVDKIVYSQRKGEKGNTVTQILVNPQSLDRDAKAPCMVAMFNFSENGQKLAIEFYSTVREVYLKNPKVIDLANTAAPVIEEDSGWMGNAIAPSGSGTEADPYKIVSGGNLLWMAEQVTKSSSASLSGKYFEQTCDIDLNGNAIYSIGYYFGGQSDMAAFGGHYDGNGYSVKNGSIYPFSRSNESSVAYGYGLFGVIFGATVEDVVLENVEINGVGLTGGIVGRAASPLVTDVNFEGFNIISGCEIKNTVKFVLSDIASASAFDNASRGGRFGSICGMAHNTVIDACTSAANIKFGGDYGIGGGIVGSFGLNSTISNSSYTGVMTLVDNTSPQTCIYGGIAGMVSPTSATYWGSDYAGYAHITNCYNSGNLAFEVDATKKNTHWAGILGGANYLPYVAPTEAVPYPYLVENCYNLSAGPAKRTRGASVYAGIAAKNAIDATTDASTLYVKDCYSVTVTLAGGDTATNEYCYVAGSTTKDGYAAVKALGTVATVNADTANSAAALIDADILAARSKEVSAVWNTGSGKPTFTPAAGTKYYDQDNGYYYTYNGEAWESANGIETKYGMIPSSYASVTDYPFVIFLNGEFKAASKVWNTTKFDGVIATAVSLATNENDVVTILLRDNYNHSATATPNTYNQLVGTLNVDLGGKTFTVNSAIMQFNHKLENSPVNVNFTNGDIVIAATCFGYLMNQSNAVNQVLNLKFDGVTIVHNTNWALISTSDNTTGLAVSNVIFNNCDIDLTAHSSSFNLITAGNDENSSHVTHVVFKGGSILSKVDFTGKLITRKTGYTGGESDTLTFERNSNDEYTKFILPDTVESISGNIYDSKNLIYVSSTADGNTTYQLVENYVEGSGSINSKYYDVEKYPFLIFKNGVNVEFTSEFEAQGKQDSWIDIIPLAVSLATSKDDVVTVALRRDYTNPASSTPNAYNALVGTLNIDLGGYTLTTGRELVQFNHKLSNSPVNVNFKNGTILVTGRRLVNLMNQSATVNQVLNLTFISVTIDYRSSWSIINGADNDSAANGTGVANVVFENSTIDLTNYTGSAFNLITKEKSNPRLNTSQVTRVVFKGGEIKANVDFSGYLFARQTDLGDTLKFEQASDGSYTKFTFKSSSSIPSELYDSEPGKLKYVLANEADGWVTYALQENEHTGYVKTEYGYIPEENANDPIVLFQYGNFVASYANWNAFNVAMGTLADTSEEANTVVLVRADCTTSESSAYFHKVQYLTIDLGGNKIIGTKGKLFNLSSVNDIAFEANITIKNGTLSSSHVTNPPITLNSSNKTNVSAKFNVTFEGVTFVAESAHGGQLVLTAFGGGTYGCVYEMNFNDCIFDATNGNVTGLFGMADASGNKFDVHVTVNGGKLIAKNEFTLATFSPDRDGNKVDTLTFGKSEDGNYTLLELASGEWNATYNDGALKFVNIGEGTYRLRPTQLANIEYAPKMSITLATGFVMNVYVPTNYTQKFTFGENTYNSSNNYGGKTVTLEDGNTYYLVTVSLGSAKAASEIKLVADINANGTAATVTFTFSIPKYAQNVLVSDKYSTVEKALVKDVLAYIREAYNYSGFASFNDADEIERVSALIESIIGDYAAAPTTTGTIAKDNGGIVTSVALNLDANPTIRFYVTNTNITFKSGDKVLGVVKGNGYVELDVYAYALCETITFGDGGSYHISSYVANAKGESYEALVKAFVKYTESAAAYRNSVIGGGN